VYYGTDTRAFLLLMGILLALVWPWIERLRQAVPLLELLGVSALVGAVLLFLRMHEFNPTLFRGGALAAAFCFAVLVAAVAHPRTGIGEALGVAPLRWVGERSYGIYLWHWPIIVLIAGVNARPSVGIVVAEAALVLAIAALSYKYVEQPIRTGTCSGASPSTRAATGSRSWARGAGPRRGLRDPVRDAGLAEPGVRLRQPAEGEGSHPPQAGSGKRARSPSLTTPVRRRRRPPCRRAGSSRSATR
jgi:peptidoglycan/LPS O-acetylase OafA/YrhL